MKQQTEATTRALMALATDMADLTEAHRRVRAQIEDLAKHHGVALPEPNLN